MFCAWGSSGDGTGRDPRGGPAEDCWGGDSGKRQDGEPQPGAREVRGSRGRWQGPAESCMLGDTEERVGSCPRCAHPREARVTLGGWVSGRMGGQFGVPLCLFGSLANLGSPIRTIWLFGCLSNGPNGPFPGRLPRDPLCQGRAGMDRPRGHASPVARAPKPWASRLLVGLPAGGAALGAEVGGGRPPSRPGPCDSPRHRDNGGWVGTRPVGLGAQATPG